MAEENGDRCKKSESPPCVVCDPREQLTEFNPLAYLNGFYGSPDDVPAMHVAMICIPSLMQRIPKGGSLIDIGSGPTVHLPMMFRHHVDAIYVSDFALTNRNFLLDWWRSSEGRWDWSHITQYLAMFEAIDHSCDKMERETRNKMAGILNCDVHNEHVVIADGSMSLNVNNKQEIEGLPHNFPQQFDVVTTFYCLEYATTTVEEYGRSLSNICSLLKPGGYLLMGGVLGADSYRLDGRKFLSLNLTEPDLFKALHACNMEIIPDSYRNINEKLIDAVFALVAKKKA